MDKEIIEGNMAIAKFMGAKYNERVGLVYLEGIPMVGLDELKYHSSWDWLLPVYNKLLATFNADRELVKAVRKNVLILNCLTTVLDASGVSLQIEISSSWLKICDVIQWYNQQNK